MKRTLGVLTLASTLALTAAATAAQPKLIVGSEDDWGAQLYGFGRLDLIYNSQRFDHPQYPSLLAAEVESAEADDEINIHPRLTRLGLSAWRKGQPDEVNLGAKLELDFQNGGGESRQTPRLRHGYASLDTAGFRLIAGQTWDLISQLYPTANADSMMWNTGNTGDRAPQLRLGYGLGLGEGTMDFDVAFLMPNVTDGRDLDGNGTPDGRDAAVPGLQGRIAYKAGLWTTRPLHVAIGGLFGRSEALLVDRLHDWTSWGVFAELDIPFSEQFGARGEWFIGQDLAEVRGGIKQGLTVTRGDDDQIIDAKEIRTMGFWAELYGAPAEWLKLAVGYGQDDPEDEDLVEGDRIHNAALWGAVHWYPVAAFRVGAEYLYWMTKYKAGSEPVGQRFNLHFTYSF